MASRNNPQAAKHGAAVVSDPEDNANVGDDQSSTKQQENYDVRPIMVGCGLFTTFLTYLALRDFIHVNFQPLLDFLYTILFNSCFLGLPVFLVIKYVVKVESRDYSDFDVIVQEVAKGVLPEEEDTTVRGGTLKTPLLHISPPPSNVTIRVQNKPHTIVTKKTGDPFVTGLTNPCVLRLNFTEKQNYHIFSIQGSATLAEGSANNNNSAAKCTTYSIQKGFLSLTTEKAYWEEQAGNNGIRRVVTGKFGEDYASFSGEWCSSDGTRGTLMTTVVEENISIDYAVPL